MSKGRIKSSEDFKRSVYAKKLARDLRRQQRRRRLAGAASALAVAVVCFGLGVFSGGHTPEESTSQAGFAANAGLYGAWTEGDVVRKEIEAHDAKKMKPGDILQVAVVIGGDTGIEAELCLTNVGTSSLRVLSVWVTACDNGEQTDLPELDNIYLQPGENRIVTLDLADLAAGERKFDAEFCYMPKNGPIMKKTVTLLWQSA